MNLNDMWTVAARNVALAPTPPRTVTTVDPDAPEPTYVLLDFPLEIFQEQAS